MIIDYTVSKIWCVTDEIGIFHLGNFLPYYPPDSPKNENLKKTKTLPRDIII